MKVSELNTSEYNNFYQTYISKVQEHDLITCLNNNLNSTLELLQGLSAEKFDFAYAQGKWTIKELLQHIIDTERIFAIRALRIARNDNTMLPGFDQDEFNETAEANSKLKQDLIEDYTASRLNTISLFKSISSTNFANIGGASGNPLTARAAAFIIVGHENHHIEILKSRYL